MSKRKKAWNTAENAQKYDAYAQKFPLYQQTSEDLVSFAEERQGMRVVDLAAGTGATSEALLKRFGNDVEIIAVDQAEEMLKKAKERFLEKENISYIVAQSEDFDKKIDDRVDLVVCNSAFWQMRPKNTLRAVSNVLKDDGRFIFNLPDGFFKHEDFTNEPRRPVSYDIDALTKWGDEASLEFIDYAIISYEGRGEAKAAFSEIPVMKSNFPNEEVRKEFMERVRTEGEESESEWMYFVFDKKSL